MKLLNKCKALFLVLLIVGMWGMVGNCEVVVERGESTIPVGQGHILNLADTCILYSQEVDIIIRSTSLPRIQEDSGRWEVQWGVRDYTDQGIQLDTSNLADTCIPFDRMSLIDPQLDTIRICCCTVFVDKPCTVYVSPNLTTNQSTILDNCDNRPRPNRRTW